MSILVIEDSNTQRENLVKMIEKEFIDIRIYQSSSITTAMSILKEKDIKLFFIDINLGDESGLELAKKIRTIPKYKLTGIVFITSQMIHIIEAFKSIHCYDFLVKPYDVSEVKKIIKLFFQEDDSYLDEDCKFSMINIDNSVAIKVYHKDILFIEYSSRSCILHTRNDKYEIKGIGLNKLLQSINDDDIIQSHKSYAINIKHIYKVEKIYNKLWDIYIKDYDEVAQLGYKYKESFNERLNKNNV